MRDIYYESTYTDDNVVVIVHGSLYWYRGITWHGHLQLPTRVGSLLGNKSFRWANAMPSNACINIVFESGNVVVERAHSVWTLYHSQHEYIILDSQLHAAQCIGRLVYMRHDIG